MATDYLTEVAALQQTAQAYADTALTNMNTFESNAANAFNNVFLQDIPLVYPFIPSSALPPISGGPAFTPATTTGPAVPTAPTIGNISAPAFGVAPQFTAVAPVFTLPAAPSATLPNAPTNQPTITTPVIPAAPSISVPAAPTFQPIVLPPVPTVNIPNFTATMDIDIPTQPTEVFSYVEAPYQDALLDELKAKLMYDLANGGYGIEPLDEIELWNRARDREMVAGEAMMQDAVRQIAARGFMMPPGAVNAQIAAAQQAVAEKNSSVNRDIGLKRADMYVENRRFTITESREVSQMLITYFGYMMERALNAAKATVEFGIKLYEARVSASNLKLERYRVQAQVYEVVLKAALAHLEEYRIQVEAARVSVEVQRVQAELYSTQVRTYEAMVSLYNAQLGAAKIQVEIEGMQLDLFKSSVQVYGMQVGAKESEFRLYAAQIQAAKAPTEVFHTQAQAYTAQVSGYEANVRAQTAVLQAQIMPAQLNIERYRADIARYSADIQRNTVELRNAVDVYGAKVRAFVSDRELALKVSETKVIEAKAQADVTLAGARQAGSIIIARGNQMISAAQAFGAINASIGSAYASVGASSLAQASGLLSSNSNI